MAYRVAVPTTTLINPDTTKSLPGNHVMRGDMGKALITPQTSNPVSL